MNWRWRRHPFWAHSRVITTATDINHAFAVDLFAKKNELAIDDLKEAKEISAAVLQGEPVGFSVIFRWRAEYRSR